MRRYGSILLVAVLVIAGFLLLGRGVRFWSEWREAQEIAAQAGRLEETVRPLAYRIALTIDPTSDRFFGEASIRVHLAQARRAIWLHGRGLKIQAAMATDARGRRVRARWKTVDERGLARLLLRERLAKGEALLHFRYEGHISSGGDGLFRVRRAGRNYVFSQMQPIAARSVFPAFDQPGFKTPFEISVRTLPGQRVIGNAPLARVERGRDGWRTWHLRATRPLPTYLVALAVGPFVEIAERHPPTSGAGTAAASPLPPMRAIGVAGDLERRALVRMLGMTRFLLGDLEDFFAHPYPFAKLDLLAVPAFAPLGMENAGAVMLRESLVAAFADAPDPARVRPGSPRWRAWIAADPRRYRAVHWLIHQLAHQWIGNLVTPAWWSDLWFSESFGRWIADHELRRLTGNAGRVDLDASLRVLRALEFDTGERARPLHRRIATTDDILTVFDPPLYDKGASVIGMVEAFSGHGVWRAVLRRLIAEHGDANIDTTTLVDALSSVAGNTAIAASFADFVHRTGVPFLEIAGRCVGTAGERSVMRVRVTQSRHHPLSAKAATAPSRQGWRVPLCLSWQAGGSSRSTGICRLLAADPKNEFSLSGPEERCPLTALRAAPLERGYYRYLPDRALRDSLWQHLDRLAADEAVSLADHLVAAMLDERLAARELLTRLAALAASPHWPALVPQIDHLHRWRMLLAPTSGTAREFAAFLRRLYGTALAQARKGRGDALYAPAFRREARYRLAAAWIVDGGMDSPDAGIAELLDPDGGGHVRGRVGRWDDGRMAPLAWALDLAALRRDPTRTLPLIAARLGREATADERRRALMALGYSGLEPAFEVLRAYALSSEADDRDVAEVLEILARDPMHASAHWQWVNTWHERLAGRLNVFTRSALIGVAAGLCDPAVADRLATIVADWREPLPGRSVAVRQTAARIRVCATEREVVMAALSRAFADKGAPSPADAVERR